jgi:tetratricopeptide (TPR) repeat protein
MKKRYAYAVILLLFVLAAGFIVVKYKKDTKRNETAFYPIKERKGSLASSEEFRQVKAKFDELMKIAGTNADDSKARLELASLYIREARVTGDYMYYDIAAMRYVNEVLGKDPENFEALIFKSILYLSQHHFTDGLAIAEKAKKVNPYNAFVYGIVVDGDVETGNYKAAVEAADKMVSIRPDLRSYSRVSYLREIYGDYPGAIGAMKMAVEAGPPGDESTEWSRIQLAHLYENTGDWKAAEMNYLISLQYRPGYAHAIAGLARVAAAAENYPKAIDYYLKADSLTNDYSIKEQLADVYGLAGQKAKADELYQWLIHAMSNDAKQGKENDAIGHYADRELANIYIKTGGYNKALEHATAEYNRRPANIDVNETMAWVYYKKGDAAKALDYLQIALSTNSRNPALLCQAALIYMSTGDKPKAKAILETVLKSNANIPALLKREALSALEKV